MATKSKTPKVLRKRLFGMTERGITSVVVTVEERYAGQYRTADFRRRFNNTLSNAHDALRKEFSVTEIRITKV
jgi:hypothetical protein